MKQKLLAELLGTFSIVFFGCGAIASLHNDPSSHFMVNAVFGLVVASAIYALGHISAAHFNPAVTIGFAAAGRFPWWAAPGHIGAQSVGALMGSGLHFLLLPERAKAVGYGMTIPALDHLPAVGIEAVLTFFLMSVIMAVATDKRVNSAVPGLAIGMAVALCGLFGGPLTGCSMNPARSLAPALFSGNLGLMWIYLAGPLIGSVLAGFCYEFLRGPKENAQGAPAELMP